MRVAPRWILPIALLVTGCGTDRQPGSLYGPVNAGDLVIDAVLIVDRPLPSVYLSRTVPPDQPVTDASSGVPGAFVEIRDGNQAYLYTNDPDVRALYHPPAGVPDVEPNTRYTITVRAEGRELTAETRTPDRFSIREAVLLDEATLDVTRTFKTYRDGEDVVFTAPENQIVYQDGLLEARFDPSDVPGYQVGIFSLDPESEFVIEADFLEPEDYEDFEREGSSPAFVAPEGTLRLPWFAVYFAGRHKIKIFAVDQNWFDFIRTSPEMGGEGGFGGLAGDAFKSPQFNVNGGLGFFASASVDSLGFVVLPRP